ncbi:MAG: M42 family metallopeptidase [Chloroflexi bacterium]|nr:M42 family metallopeptidase [Chloroflexota bacterium]
MKETTDLLKKLIATAGLPGYETPVREIIEKAWGPLVDELKINRLGNLYGYVPGTGKEPRSSILIAAHMDAIGFMVTSIKDSFLHITQIGGIDPRILPGQMVTIHGRKDFPGMIIQPPAHTLPEGMQNGVVPLSDLLVETGLTAAQTSRQVRIGDLISFASTPIEIKGDLLAGHSMDNRASVVALTEALKLLKKRHHEWDVWAVATSQEEVTLGGAAVSSFDLRPTLAVVVDVTYAKGPGATAHLSYAMDKGPALGWGPNIHPKLFQAFEDLAEKLEIPNQKELMSRMSGTDAITMQVAAEGVPTMVISIPLRYMHTPYEIVHLKDITRTGRLLAEFICELDDKFMDTLRWDESEKGVRNSK